ncbi:MAG: recombinase, partial [Oscillospiraceae bacterium]
MTGHYAEIYFPSRGVRYIAVNDGYDSGGPDSDIAPFRNVLNEMYARDTSRKIRSAFLAKMRSGAYIGNFAPYGYRKDPQNKNRLLPEAAEA